MPSSPKLDATLLPRVSIRRASAHIVKRFFFARRGSRRTLILFIALAVIYFLFIRSDDNLHDMQFDDSDQDIVQHPKQAHKEHAAALQALQKERERKAETRPPMTHSRDGLIRVGDWEGIHPLLQVIETAENQWKTEIDFRPSTLSEAYDSYMALYGESPPPSFPHFFNLLSPQCPMPSFSSLRLYKPVTSSLLRRHQLGLEGSPMTITVVIRSGRVGGGAADEHDNLFHVRETSRHLMNVLSEISESLPDLRFTLSADYPRNPLPHHLRMDLTERLRLGDRFDEADSSAEEQDDNGVYSFHNWKDACAPTDPLQHGPQIGENPKNGLKFIYTSTALSICQHPSLTLLSDYFAGPSPNFGVVNPVFSLLTTAIHGDILLPRPEISQTVPSKVPWGRKRLALYWRGPAGLGATPDEFAVPINRLMALFNNTGIDSPLQHILVPKGDDRFEVQVNHPLRSIKTQIDLAFTGCGDQIGCGNMYERYTFAEGAEVQWQDNKFVLDLESTKEVASFRQLLLSGSLVLRASLFEDFWVAQAKPWVHYVPVQPDFSDLATIILFFEAHDHLAKRIALAGQSLARECFGRAGIKAGLMGILGEYGRMWNDDRRVAT